MKRYIFILLLLSFFSLEAKEIPHVLVSVAPHKYFVEKISGDLIEVELMVPAGASSHTFEPTPRQILHAGQASIWFRLGEPFEDRAIRAIKSHHPTLQVVDLRKNLDLIPSQCCCSHSHGEDLHFWLSPRLAKIQAQTIRDTLVATYPQYQEEFQKNLLSFHRELDDLNSEIHSILDPLQNRNILVSHPAYGYFCRDYNLNQHSIEFEGKDPTPQQLTKTLGLAKKWKTRTIFIQMQYNSKGARLIADEIGAKIVVLDPYSENYKKSLLEIAHAFAEGL
jgi:zinc transport system substrate-binding protein